MLGYLNFTNIACVILERDNLPTKVAEIDVDRKGRNALMDASACGRADIAAAILQRDNLLDEVFTTQDRSGMNALMLASKKGYTQTLPLVLS